MEPFVHLHVHTQYSMLDGQASIDALLDKAQNDGMRAIAITDHGNMFGVKEFFNKVNKRNAKYKGKPEDEDKLFKPILGCECYCARNGRHNKNGKEDLGGWHLIVLAKTLKGYKNLIKMVSYAWTEGSYGRPRIDKELLEKYHEDLIVTSACLGGEIPQQIKNRNIDKAEEAVLWFKNLFGEDFYIELQRHPTNDPNANCETYPLQKEVNKVLIELARKHDVKLIASNDVHFVNAEDAEAHDRLICLSTGKDLDDPSRMRYSKQEWMKTTAEMNALFQDVPEALRNTLEIAEKVEFYSIDSGPLMPDFPIPPEFNNDDEYLRHLTYLGAEKKYGDQLNDEIRERIDFELDTIKGMGFPGYFLIVQDFIAAARAMGVAVGPGRGSAAGSAVAYCLGITDIDPVKYDLLFERFLNPDRISMPDIDVDFDDDGRGRVLEWVTDKYGKEKVAHIITYGTMATKSAIKDVARVQKLPLADSNRLAKLVPDKLPDGKKVNLRTAIEHVPELREAAASPDPVMRDTLKYAQMLEGNVRNTGVHACGVIIGKTDISDVVPVSTAKDKETGEEMLVTQYEGSVIEDTGLIKMDFLGLKTLSIIKEAIENIEQTTGVKIDIDKIDIEDAKTYELYSAGKTTGTFQFESAGMQKYLRELQPTKFEDLIAMNALYRPGPMEYIPQFIARKHGREEIAYDIPIMERYLKDTYGITVYQEQVMLLSRLLANFTRGQSDELRKAMGKKLIDKMNALKEKFLSGGKANGHEEKTLLKIWGDWEKFASYAFNKSHATCYSWVSYQTAYLKAHYPSEYMAAVLSRNISNITEITKFMDECKAMDIQVLGPDVNESSLKFSVNKKGDIRFGLGAVKGVGESAVRNIIEERKKEPFKSVFDFVERVSLTTCNKKNIESLALAGAFDNFGIRREQFFAAGEKDGEMFLDTLIRYGNKFQIDKASAANSLFGMDNVVEISKPAIPTCESWSDLERLNREKELVGIYLSAHPLDEYQVILTYACNTGVAELNDKDLLKGRDIMLGGIVTDFREGTTKTGNQYGILKIEDFTGSAEIPLFGKDYIEYGKYGRPGMYLLIRGKMEPRRWREEEVEFKIGTIGLLQDVKESLIETLRITLPIHCLNDKIINELSVLIKNNPGNSLLYFKMIDKEYNVMLDFTSKTIKLEVTLELINFLKNNEEIEFKING
ncbi:DNA polymerase-3 subunit alpha [Parabacteroides sp. PFB2-12]|uniref:DNA polymerase III subunit alpha n=1 Tax=unclassified Parabacteroides TaxID=2649774 RepID=UPI0024758602|nr:MULTISPECIES: DNA polymerase III subunit alpha [unclassified Parabacteroides]MDH6343584.1 DNA polymerase-3 subunit alpha [Parabacteroides sp. PM6-13]MDH6391435.1 DNA polymerase-3 subunit alpha [Parabacteroides sp. PFB2-12]